MLVEDDGVTTDPFEVKVAVVVRGDEVIADFTGSSPQVRGPMNCTFVVAASAVYNAVFCVTDPQTLIPRNSGCYRPMRIIAPPGSVVNVSTRARRWEGTPTCSRSSSTSCSPRSRRRCPSASPPRPAARARTSSSAASIRDRPLLLELPLRRHGGGATAPRTATTPRSRATRTAATRRSRSSSTATRSTPLDYGLAADSGGAGNHSGGLGDAPDARGDRRRDHVQRAVRPLAVPPTGLFGGGPAAARSCSSAGPGGEFRRFDEVFGVASPTKFTNVVLRRGDQLRYVTPGGAGFGDPAERDPELVREDVREGYASAEAALRDYGVEVSPDERALGRVGALVARDEVVHCSVCGTLIPRRAWIFEGGPASSRRAALNASNSTRRYWKPTYGVMTPG